VHGSTRALAGAAAVLASLVDAALEFACADVLDPHAARLSAVRASAALMAILCVFAAILSPLVSPVWSTDG
jgi:hypothetical protein